MLYTWLTTQLVNPFFSSSFPLCEAFCTATKLILYTDPGLGTEGGQTAPRVVEETGNNSGYREMAYSALESKMWQAVASLGGCRLWGRTEPDTTEAT